MQETYWPQPRGTYEERRQLYLAYAANNPQGGMLSKYARVGFFSQIARLELGQAPIDEEAFYQTLEFVDARYDCCDFSVGGLLRTLYKYRESPLLARELVAAIEERILNFKYWWDDPIGDNQRCYHTENHQIIFHADELLAAQLFPDATFKNSGRSAAYHRDHALHLIRRWFDFRAQFGFSEWLSNCYFEEDLLGLVNLYDFAQQDDVRQQAKLCIDMLLFEMALHTYRGIMGCTHGRTYAWLIKGARQEDASSTARLMFGMGLFTNPHNLGTIPLATSGYRCPAIIEKIAADLEAPRLFRERHSIEIADAPAYGLSWNNMEDGHLFWSIQDYIHERVYNLAQQTRQAYGVMLYEDYQPRYEAVWQWQTAEYGAVVDRNIDCHGLTEVHIQTYRTGHYMLSCAQDFRPGRPGYQQHPWQATLGPDAVVFTNHPGSDNETSRPNFWAGNGILPRAVQHQNVLICIHHIPAGDAFAFSHAYFPRDAFDEVIEPGPLDFARKGGGYLALYSQHPTLWLADAAGRRIELRAARRITSGSANWAIQTSGPISPVSPRPWPPPQFAATALTSTSDSPSLGHVEFGWEEPLRVAGAVVALHDYPRFDNPYCQAEFGSTRYEITYQDQKLVWDFALNRS